MPAKANTTQAGYLRRAQAANYLSISIRTLANLQNARAISFSKIGKSVLFRITDLDNFVSKFRVNAIGEVTK